MITREFAHHFANHWIDAWNKHDMDKILSHYTEDFEMSSPYIAQIAGEATATLKGKNTVSAYWSKALTLIPDLHFELITTLVGVESITLYYRGARGLAAEVFFFDTNNRVFKACAHYA